MVTLFFILIAFSFSCGLRFIYREMTVGISKLDAFDWIGSALVVLLGICLFILVVFAMMAIMYTAATVLADSVSMVISHFKL